MPYINRKILILQDWYSVPLCIPLLRISLMSLLSKYDLKRDNILTKNRKMKKRG